MTTGQCLFCNELLSADVCDGTVPHICGKRPDDSWDAVSRRIADGDVILNTLREAARAVALTPGIPVSTTYECAREVWGLWWKRYEMLRKSTGGGV